VEPIKVISTTSLLIDFYFKRQVEEKEFKINWKRVTTTSLFGFAFVGPVGHFWWVFSVIFIYTFYFWNWKENIFWKTYFENHGSWS